MLGLVLFSFLLASAHASPYIYGSAAYAPLTPSWYGPIASAAYTSPILSRSVSPYAAAIAAPVQAAVPPYSSVSAYQYGSGYSVQEYPGVIAPVPAVAYTAPYALEADWLFRR